MDSRELWETTAVLEPELSQCSNNAEQWYPWKILEGQQSDVVGNLSRAPHILERQGFDFGTVTFCTVLTLCLVFFPSSQQKGRGDQKTFCGKTIGVSEGVFPLTNF